MSGSKRDYFDFIEQQEVKERIEQFDRNLREQDEKYKKRKEYEIKKESLRNE